MGGRGEGFGGEGGLKLFGANRRGEINEGGAFRANFIGV